MYSNRVRERIIFKEPCDRETWLIGDCLLEPMWYNTMEQMEGGSIY